MAQYRTFQQEMARLTAQGYEVVWQRGNEAQLRRGKRFSFWWFLFWTVFSLGLLFWLYPVWHWAKRDELVFLRMEEGRLVVTSNWWPFLKVLAFGLPVIGFVALVAAIAAVAATRGGDDGESKVAGQPVTTTRAAPERKPNEAALAVGSAAELENSVRLRIDNIIDPCMPSFAGLEPEQPGTHRVVFHFAMENLGGREQGPIWLFTAKDAGGFHYEASSSTSCQGQRDLEWCGFTKVVTEAECGISFQVRDGQQIVELRYDPNPFTTTDIVFRAQ